MNLEKIKEILISEPPYRKKQIYKLLFSELIEDWQKATTLPLSLRKKLKFGVSFDIKAQPYFSKTELKLKRFSCSTITEILSVFLLKSAVLWAVASAQPAKWVLGEI